MSRLHDILPQQMSQTIVNPTLSAPAPTDTQPDWQAIKVLYLQGSPLADISRQFNVPVGTIRNRAWRSGWRNESLADCSEQPAAIQELVKEWFGNMAISLLARSKWWANNEIEPVCMKEAKEMENAIQSHISSGRMLFGLDKGQDGSVTGWGPQAGAPIIDVTPVALPNASKPTAAT